MEIMRKIHLRLYLIPNRMQHIHPDSPKLCWRRCGTIGTQLHMWKSCPTTQIFWRAVTDVVSEVLHLQFPITLHTLVQHILISARFVIAQNWKPTSLLPISEVIRRMNFHFHCETVVLTSPSQSLKLMSLWEPWSDLKNFVP